MSIRRRNIRARVEREKRLAKERAEMTAALDRMRSVLDEMQSEGLETYDPNEFWRRYHARADGQ